MNALAAGTGADNTSKSGGGASIRQQQQHLQGLHHLQQPTEGATVGEPIAGSAAPLTPGLPPPAAVTAAAAGAAFLSQLPTGLQQSLNRHTMMLLIPIKQPQPAGDYPVSGRAPLISTVAACAPGPNATAVAAADVSMPANPAAEALSADEAAATHDRPSSMLHATSPPRQPAAQAATHVLDGPVLTVGPDVTVTAESADTSQPITSCVVHSHTTPEKQEQHQQPAATELQQLFN